MGYYLQMDGVDDRISFPSMTIKEVSLDIVPESLGVASTFFDARTGIGFSYLNRSSTGVYSVGTGTVYVNSVQQGNNGALGIIDNSRQTIRIVFGSAGTDDVTLFATNSNLAFAKGKIYGATFKDSVGSIVAQYDMTLGNVQDQSGNGFHATLTGGTWVDDGLGGGGDPEPVSTYFRKRNLMGLIY